MPNIQHLTLNRKTCQGISVSIPSWFSVIELGTDGASPVLLEVTVMVKVGRTAISTEFVIAKV